MFFSGTVHEVRIRARVLGLGLCHERLSHDFSGSCIGLHELRGSSFKHQLTSTRAPFRTQFKDPVALGGKGKIVLHERSLSAPALLGDEGL